MKNSIYILLLVTVSLSIATAQTERGRWTVGTQVGGLSYFDQGNISYKSFSANLTPLAGYFVSNGLLIGTGLPLNLSIIKSGSSTFRDETTTTGIGLSPFIRYYFGPSALKPYVGLSYSYVRSGNKFETPFGDVSGKGYSTNLSPTVGIAYFINRNIALNAGLNYNIQTSETSYIRFVGSSQPAPMVTTTKSDYKSLSLTIGFQLFFGK
ncbi:outer membrane beta-barrel protein [Spirosoma arcticum]